MLSVFCQELDTILIAHHSDCPHRADFCQGESREAQEYSVPAFAICKNYFIDHPKLGSLKRPIKVSIVDKQAIQEMHFFETVFLFSKRAQALCPNSQLAAGSHSLWRHTKILPAAK